MAQFQKQGDLILKTILWITIAVVGLIAMFGLVPMILRSI